MNHNYQNKKMFDRIRKGIDNGIYKAVRLSKSHVPDEERILIPFSKITDTSKAIARLDHIRYQIEHVLGPGEYIIEARTGNNQSSLVDMFPFKIKARISPPIASEGEEPGTGVQERIEDKTFEQEIMNDPIDFDDYVNLIKENERLKAQNALLATQLELAQKQPQLSEPAPSLGEKAIQALADNAPVILGIFDKYFQQKDRQLDIEEQRIRPGMRKKKVVTRKPTREEILSEMQSLEQSDPDSFDATLDEMEQQDPELFDYICNEMGLYEEEEPETTEE
jgi:hypothetical protein